LEAAPLVGCAFGRLRLWSAAPLVGMSVYEIVAEPAPYLSTTTSPLVGMSVYEIVAEPASYLSAAPYKIDDHL